jgi:hypothetical protein
MNCMNSGVFFIAKGSEQEIIVHNLPIKVYVIKMTLKHQLISHPFAFTAHYISRKIIVAFPKWNFSIYRSKIKINNCTSYNFIPISINLRNFSGPRALSISCWCSRVIQHVAPKVGKRNLDSRWLLRRVVSFFETRRIFCCCTYTRRLGDIFKKYC